MHQQLANIDDPDLQAIARRFRTGLDTVQQGAQLILNDPAENNAPHGAISFHMLMMMGTVCGGWQMARAALKAYQKLESGASDPDFYKTKIVTARFFADHLLPRCVYHLEVMQSGGKAVMDLDEKYF